MAVISGCCCWPEPLCTAESSSEAPAHEAEGKQQSIVSSESTSLHLRRKHHKAEPWSPTSHSPGPWTPESWLWTPPCPPADPSGIHAPWAQCEESAHTPDTCRHPAFPRSSLRAYKGIRGDRAGTMQVNSIGQSGRSVTKIQSTWGQTGPNRQRSMSEACTAPAVLLGGWRLHLQLLCGVV